MLNACRTPVQDGSGVQEDPYAEPLMEVNRYLLERHRDRIEAFVDRAGWNMEETATGLWYEILEQGTGRKAGEGLLVSYAYTMRLLDGTFCYSADTISPKMIVLGKGGIVSGMEQGLAMMHEGGRARLIIPPHLGHGNFGDRDRIPGSSILLVEVQMLEVKR